MAQYYTRQFLNHSAHCAVYHVGGGAAVDSKSWLLEVVVEKLFVGEGLPGRNALPQMLKGWWRRWRRWSL